MSQRVLVLNAGSSSLKFKLFDAQHTKILGPAASGLIEQIGTPERSAITAHAHHDHTTTTTHKQHRVAVENYTQALDLVLGFLKDTFTPAVVDQVKAVGHRVVHGKHINAPALLTPPVLEAIRDATDLAPLHNPPNLQGIEAAQRTFSHCPQVWGLWMVVVVVVVVDYDDGPPHCVWSCMYIVLRHSSPNTVKVHTYAPHTSAHPTSHPHPLIRLRCLTQPFTKQCPPLHTPMPFPTPSHNSMVYESMVFMVSATTTWSTKLQQCFTNLLTRSTSLHAI